MCCPRCLHLNSKGNQMISWGDANLAGLTTLGQPRLSEGAQPYPLQPFFPSIHSVLYSALPYLAI